MVCQKLMKRACDVVLQIMVQHIVQLPRLQQGAVLLIQIVGDVDVWALPPFSQGLQDRAVAAPME